MNPVHCQSPDEYQCFCCYRRQDGANIYNCSSPTAHTLPPHLNYSEILRYSNKLVVHNTNITELCGSFPYLKTFFYLDLRNNNISSISQKFAEELKGYSNTDHKLSHLQQIWLSDNPYHCDCNMAWMIGWLHNFTTLLGKHVIVDYNQIKCHTGMMVGKSIIELDKVEMGCFPPELTLWQNNFLGLSAGVTALIIAGLTYLVIKRSRDVKFFLYYYCKWCTCFGLPKDDKNENLDNMEYDAYLSYRYIKISSM